MALFGFHVWTGHFKLVCVRDMLCIVCAVTSMCVLPACGDGSASAPTFTRDIAPIVYENCAACHRPGESGPFPLLTYEDVSAHATQIAEVTQSGFMPPWLPEHGAGKFADARLLDDEQIATIAAWVEAGAPRGDAADLPPMPRFTDGWELGKPDLIVETPAYTLGPDGPDVYRNFVVRIPVDAPRYVRTVEFQPGNPRAIHHAGLAVDRTGAARRLDAQDDEPGFDGMAAQIKGADTFDGLFLPWNPGAPAFPGYDGVAWLVEPGTDLIVQLHMPRTGRTEQVHARIGLHFTDTPPTRHPVMFRLGSFFIDIPPGERYVHEDSYTLPVDVRALSVTPHAHYLCTEMHGEAVLPDGTRLSLIDIPEWDFNWQGSYRYAQPPALPAGTTLTMRFVYDNTTGNVRNPHHPPQHVIYGPNTTDEMGGLWLQLLPDDSADVEALRRDFQRKILEHYVNDRHRMLAVGHALYDKPLVARELGHLMELLRQPNEALRHYNDAIARDPTRPEPYVAIGMMHQRRGAIDDAMALYRRALQLDPTHAEAHLNLGVALRSQGRTAEAIEHYRRAIAADPTYVRAHNNLGAALGASGRTDEAIASLQRAVALDPGFVDAQANLGMTLLAAGRIAEAGAHYRAAVAAVHDVDQALTLALEAARATGSRDAGLLLAVADAQIKAGRHQAAAATLAQAVAVMAADDAALHEMIKARRQRLVQQTTALR